MDEIERLKKLAGVGEVSAGNSMGENLSYTGTAKAEYERKHTSREGQTNGSNYGSQDPTRRVKTQCLKNKYLYANTGIQSHRYKLS